MGRLPLTYKTEIIFASAETLRGIVLHIAQHIIELEAENEKLREQIKYLSAGYNIVNFDYLGHA